MDSPVGASRLYIYGGTHTTMQAYSVEVDGKKIVMLTVKPMTALAITRFLVEKFGRNRVGMVRKYGEGECSMIGLENATSN